MSSPTRLARHLRRNMTDVERHLWRRLRDRQVKGFKFRRQHPFREYVLDFVCLEAKVVIELDGSQHFDTQSHDAVRTSQLEAAGFQVLRFWNNEVLSNIEGVLEIVWRALPEEIRPPPSRPSPLQGEGENSVRAVSNLSQLDAITPSPCKGEGGDRHGRRKVEQRRSSCRDGGDQK